MSSQFPEYTPEPGLSASETPVQFQRVLVGSFCGGQIPRTVLRVREHQKQLRVVRYMRGGGSQCGGCAVQIFRRVKSAGQIDVKAGGDKPEPVAVYLDAFIKEYLNLREERKKDRGEDWPPIRVVEGPTRAASR